MALKRGKKIFKSSKKGIMFTLLTIILFVLMLAEVIMYVVINNTYNQQASEASAVIGAGSMINTLKDALGPFLISSTSRAIGVYLPANTVPQYPLNNTEAGALSSLVFNGTIGGTSYPGMDNATVMSYVEAMDKQAASQNSNTVIYNSSITMYQDSPAYINVSYTGMAIVNTTYGVFTYPLSIEVSYPTLLAYVNITVDNAQNAAAQGPFQQMVKFNPSSYSAYESAGLGNIRFYHGSTELFSWCESGCNYSSTGSTFWVALPGGITANSNTVITMGFMPKSIGYGPTNSPADYAGEAPQLSPSYGEYDNGANVFDFYDNFAGSTLNTSKWQVITSGSGTYSVDNGITLSESGYTTDMRVVSKSTYTGISDGMITSQNLGSFRGTGMEMATVLPTSSGFQSGYRFYASDNHPTGTVGGFIDAVVATSGTNVGHNSTNPPGAPYVMTVYWPKTGIEGWQNNYGYYLSLTNNTVSAAPYYLSLYAGSDGSNIGTIAFSYVRVRANLPNNVMPSTTFGSVTTVT